MRYRMMRRDRSMACASGDLALRNRGLTILLVPLFWCRRLAVALGDIFVIFAVRRCNY